MSYYNISSENILDLLLEPYKGMEIIIKSLRCKRFYLELDLSNTIGDIKYIIFEKDGIETH